VSGAVLVLHGLRKETGDIDCFLKEETVDRLRNLLVPSKFTRPNGHTVEVFSHTSTGVDIHYPDSTLSHLAIQKLGKWSAWTLEGNLEFKLILNRKKDQEDIFHLKMKLGI
jgi:hypothetical protein